MNTERDWRCDDIKTQLHSPHEQNKQTHSQILFFTATIKMSGLVAVAASAAVAVAEPPPPAAAKPPSPPPPARGPWPRC